MTSLPIQSTRVPASIPFTRTLLAVLTLSSTGLATLLFYRNVAADGLTLIDIPLVVLFAVLFVWVSLSFWVATLGMVAILFGRPAKSRPEGRHGRAPLHSRTAILMPVYNEDPTTVFAGVRAMLRSLQATGQHAQFDFFILSDTTNPDLWLEEERCWAKLTREMSGYMQVFYRHRAKNTSRKAGNIADFCCRWGEHYKYMVVLDADSVMEGETLHEMVLRMERDPQIGILQVPPTPVNRQSVFARMQQFAARVYGPVFLEGLAQWSKCDGNYWGHNAIIRIAPFMEHSDLPILPGNGPLGGEILSHDFVEAALIRRAGWKVCLAHDLAGSYEECPTTMLDFAQRDQRWCQGNMQHMRLLLADGLHPASRMHLGMGVMSYLASPLWLTFLVLTLLAAWGGEGWFTGEATDQYGLWLFGTTMAMLLLPKLWGLITLPLQPQGVASHGGWLGVITSTLLEAITSVFVAPIMMLLHTTFVLSTLSGHKVAWNAQQRDDHGVTLAAAWSIHAKHTLFGLAATIIVSYFAPHMLLWLSPVLIGLVLSIPLSMLIGSSHIGRLMASKGLLLIPEETNPPAVLKWQQEAQQETSSETGSKGELFDAVLYDPAFFALHVGILHATDCHVPVSADNMIHVIDEIQARGANGVSKDDRTAVLNDATALEKLHILARSQAPRNRSALLA